MVWDTLFQGKAEFAAFTHQEQIREKVLNPEWLDYVNKRYEHILTIVQSPSQDQF